MDLNNRIRGVLVGTAVGDSLGLPAEGIPRSRIQKLFKRGWTHRFAFGRGMLSDDTEHAIFVAQSLIEAPESSALFTRRLAGRLKLWLLLLPAGVGFATLRAILRLYAGISPEDSGVESAGNGPAMRSAPIGAFFYDDPGLLSEYTAASSRITHRDARANTGALAVAKVIAWTIRDNLEQRPDRDAFISLLLSSGDDAEWAGIIERMDKAIENEYTVGLFAEELDAGKGISGYVYCTVPLALYAWYRHFGDFRQTLQSVLDCGGDTDTAGAIAGAMAGAVTAEEGIPDAWINGVCDWPRSMGYITGLADNLASARNGASIGLEARYFWPALVPRNLLFLGVVLAHGFRRMLPPY